MNRPVFVPSFFLACLLTIPVVLCLGVVEAQVMTSSNYQIQSDSVNVGGGLSSSSNYTQESTLGEVATGLADSDTYSLRAGYQQLQEVFIGIGVSGDVSMNPSLSGLTGGTSTGSTTITVTTDGPAGYQLTFVAENAPAMQGPADTIGDFEPSGDDPDYSMTISGPDARFAYSPEGLDIVADFRNDAGQVCAQGSLDDPQACWAGPSTTPRVIAQANGATHPDGATTTLQFMVKVGSGAVLLPGVYTATTTVTALPL